MIANENTLKLIGILIMVGSILWASLAVYSGVSKQVEKTSERLEQVYNW